MNERAEVGELVVVQAVDHTDDVGRVLAEQSGGAVDSSGRHRRGTRHVAQDARVA